MMHGIRSRELACTTILTLLFGNLNSLPKSQQKCLSNQSSQIDFSHDISADSAD